MNQKAPLIITGASALILVLALVGMYVSFYNTAVKLENATVAQYEQNQNNYDKFWKSISEMSQVPDKYKEDFKEVLLGNTEARYGEGGSKATFQWIQEHSVNFDSGMYTKLMTAIEAGRRDFENNQKILLDKQRRYRDHLQTVRGSLFSGSRFPRQMSGPKAPTEDLDGDGRLSVLDYPIVTSQRTKRAFAEGEDEPLQVFNTATK